MLKQPNFELHSNRYAKCDCRGTAVQSLRLIRPSFASKISNGHGRPASNNAGRAGATRITKSVSSQVGEMIAQR